MRTERRGVAEGLFSVVRERTGFLVPLTRMGIAEELAAGRSDVALPVPGEGLLEFLRRRTPSSERLFQEILHLLLPRETSFFRDRPQFDSIRDEILPELMGRQGGFRPLRVLCAGCATGEEAYTMAILVREASARSGLPIPASRVLGVDVDRAAIELAREGLYGEYSFRGVSAEEKGRYFLREGDRYRVRPELRRLVDFHPMNLSADPIPNPAFGVDNLDLVICRNLLLYIEPDVAARVAHGIRAALAPGGVLIVGHAEYALDLFDGLVRRALRGTVAFQRKKEGTAPSVPVPGRDAAAGNPMDAVRHLYARKDYDGAERRLKTLREDPACRAEASYWTARIAANRDDRTGARRDLRRCIELDPGHAAAQQLLALLLIEDRRIEEGLQALRIATGRPGAPATAFHWLARLLRERGDPEGARQAARQGLRKIEGRPGEELLEETDGLTVSVLRSLLQGELA